jgi:hypothetical protein
MRGGPVGVSIFATLFELDDDNHDWPECAKYVQTQDSTPGAWSAAGNDGRYWVRNDKAAFTCGNPPPLVYRGSHVNPSVGDPRGGVLLVCGIPDHCHPDARWDEDDDGRPVEFLRLFASEDETTDGGSDPGQATLVLDLKQVTELRDALTEWIDSRSVDKREDGGHVPY